MTKNEEKRQRVMAAMGKYAGRERANHMIAREAGVSEGLVRKMLKEGIAPPNDWLEALALLTQLDKATGSNWQGEAKTAYERLLEFIGERAY